MGRTDDGQLDADVRAWLTERFASHLRRPVEEIDADRPFTEYGFDSVAAMSVSVDIEEEYGITLDAGAMWERPTVASLSRLLTDRLAGHAGTSGGTAGV